MPRSYRPRRSGADAVEDEADLARVIMGGRHTEAGRGGLWNVQPVSGQSAVTAYTCPGCGLEIAPGIPHVVAWRADGLMGEAEDLAARRHWHSHCWKIG